MNGPTDDDIFILDSCTCINFLNRKISVLPKGDLYISVITRIEVLSYPKQTTESEAEAGAFLDTLTVVPLIEEVEKTAISIRRFGSPRLKLPDAVIAATAIALNGVLVTNDDDLLKLAFSGLATQRIS
jgi:predicted nucleic acid-binding protein